jgi:hypothetical protein
MRGGHHCQQMSPPQLGGAESVSSPTSELSRAKLGNELIRNMIAQSFQ